MSIRTYFAPIRWVSSSPSSGAESACVGRPRDARQRGRARRHGRAPFVVAGRAVLSDFNPLQVLGELTAGRAAISELVESFGQRNDVTLRAFGYQLLSTGHGQWIVQA
jgi:hypothetical protein